MLDRPIIDARGPTDWNRRPELKKLRARILAGAFPKPKPKRTDFNIYAADYADTMGWDWDTVQERIAAHAKAIKDAPVAQECEAPRIIDARGPTDWNRRPELKKLRARILSEIDTRVRTGKA